MSEEKKKISFLLRRGDKFRLKKQLTLPSGAVVSEGAEGRVTFAGADIPFSMLRSIYPNKVAGIRKSMIGNKYIPPKEIRLEYAEDVFVEGSINPHICFYEVTFANPNDVSYNSNAHSLDSVIYRIPWKQQENMEVI